MSLTKDVAADFGVNVLQQIHDKLPYAEMEQRKWLVRSIDLLRRAPENVALMREAETYIRLNPPADHFRAKIKDALHPKLLFALQQTMKGQR